MSSKSQVDELELVLAELLVIFTSLALYEYFIETAMNRVCVLSGCTLGVFVARLQARCK